MAANPRLRNDPALEDSGTDYLEPFIESTITAAARFRRVLLVIIITSVLAFGAFWNSAAWSWFNARVVMAHKAKTYLDLERRLAQIRNALEHSLSPLSVGAEGYKNLEERKTILEKEQQELQADMKGTDPSVREWLARRGISSKEDLDPVLQRLEGARSEAALIHIPFFGNVLDINDLGLLGGFTFVIILMWFRFSLWREYYNLSLTFDEAKEEHLPFCYKSLAMRQVLTVPPTLSGKQPQVKPWGKVVRVLYFLPVLVQLAVLVNDCCTFYRGWVISRFNTIFSISVSLCFLVLSLLLTCWCFQLSRDIDKKWDEEAEDIRKLVQEVNKAKLRK